jgi:NAD(P)-dependent dehydrogenase (short-subunit alcohol dehydrogenase family)
MKKLDGKITLVTGGTSGIGLATAKLFKENGATVIVTARTEASAKTAQQELGNDFEVIATDVSNLGELDRLYSKIKAKHGKLDVLFANAGVATFTPTSDVTAEHFDQQFNTNVRGLYFTVAKALNLLGNGGSVILNASALAVKGTAAGTVYSATKAAVRSFARSWTAEIPVEKTRFNVVSPGPIETPIYGKVGLSAEQVSGMSESLLAAVPAHRFGKSEEIAKVALFLASSDSSYICGADIAADGGYSQV